MSASGKDLFLGSSRDYNQWFKDNERECLKIFDKIFSKLVHIPLAKGDPVIGGLPMKESLASQFQEWLDSVAKIGNMVGEKGADHYQHKRLKVLWQTMEDICKRLEDRNIAVLVIKRTSWPSPWAEPAFALKLDKMRAELKILCDAFLWDPNAPADTENKLKTKVSECRRLLVSECKTEGWTRYMLEQWWGLSDDTERAARRMPGGTTAEGENLLWKLKPTDEGSAPDLVDPIFPSIFNDGDAETIGKESTAASSLNSQQSLPISQPGSACSSPGTSYSESAM